MEFGLFCGGYIPASMSASDPQAEHTRLMSEADLCVVADQHNWKYAWLTEHHFLKEYSHISANEVLAPHILARTENIHVGSGIINVTPPVNHPARVAERVAMLDHLSNGRFEFGTGRGSSTTEQAGFGITDPELTKDMYDEVIVEFKKMWRDGTYTFDGRFFTMPERNVLPKPYVKPHPPMWVAAGNPGTFEKAAKMGLGVLCFTGGSPAKMAPLIELYKKNIKDAEPVGEFVNDNIMVTTQLLCLEDGQRARDLAAGLGMGYHRSLLLRYLDTFPRPAGIPEWPALLPDPTPEQIDESIAAGDTPYGTPDEVEVAIRRYADAGVDQVVFGLLSSTMERDVAFETIETFGRHVLPTFDTDPRHRSTRQREAAATSP